VLEYTMTYATTGNFTSAQLRDQAATLVFASFDISRAIALGEIALEIARTRSLPVAIEVWHTGRLVFKAALPGSSRENDDWLRRKRNVVERLNMSTMAARIEYEEKGQEFIAATGLPSHDYAAHGGGWPIEVAGTGTVGFLGISGLPQVQDHELIVECLTAAINAGS
jgi:uncharacterized protein (UPF0303 family)